MAIEKSLNGGTFKMRLPYEYESRECAMIEEFCEFLAYEVTGLTKIQFRLYVEEYDLTKKKISWQAKLASQPEIVQISPKSAPVISAAAQIQYEAFSHRNSKDNYHGCFNMAIQTIAVQGDRAALTAGKKWIIDSRAYSVLRLAESLYRSAIKNHYHEWRTHYKDALLFVENPEVFMRDLHFYPELQKVN